MEKRYQIFISSTFADLEEERKEVMEAIINLNCFPAGMEMFPATDINQFEYIKTIIEQSDYYVLIIAGRYGSVAEDGKSYTEKEYEYAREKGIPVLVFVKRDIENIPASKIDNDPKLKEKLIKFRDSAMKNRLAKFWNEKSDLKYQVYDSLSKSIKMIPRDGWIKGESCNYTNDNGKINKYDFSNLLSEGEEKLTIFYDLVNMQNENDIKIEAIKFTWNSLFKKIHGYFYEYIEFDSCKSIIENMLKKDLYDNNINLIKVHTDDFKKIIYKFEKLELLTLYKSDIDVYVRISDKGKKYYKELCILKK